jgi:hypothetical protein
MHMVSCGCCCTSSYNGASAGLSDSKQQAVQIRNTIQHLCHNTDPHTSVPFFMCMFYHVQASKDLLLSLCTILHDSLGVLCNKNNKTAELHEYQNVSWPHHTSLQDTH